MQFHFIKMIQYFLKPYEPFGRDINVKVNLSNYATKADLENAAGIDTSKLAPKSDLASLKGEVDKLDIDKLVSVPVDLSKLSDVIKHVVKKTVHDKLVVKVKNIDTSGFVLKTKDDTNIKIPDTIGLFNKTDYNAKITEIENKIPSISGLATNGALTTVENKIPNNSSLVKNQTATQKLVKLKRNLLIMIMINILLSKNLII